LPVKTTASEKTPSPSARHTFGSSEALKNSVKGSGFNLFLQRSSLRYSNAAPYVTLTQLSGKPAGRVRSLTVCAPSKIWKMGRTTLGKIVRIGKEKMVEIGKEKMVEIDKDGKNWKF
jgi:hypothetical protein